MEVPNSMGRPSLLQIVLGRALAEGGNPRDAQEELEDYVVRSGSDAATICEALEKILAEGIPRTNSPIYLLCELCCQVQDVDAEAFDVLYERGTGVLCLLTERALEDPPADEEDILCMLEVLARYGSEEGTEMVIRAARKPVGSSPLKWFQVLCKYNSEHPRAERLYEALSSPIPKGLLGLLLASFANEYLSEGGEGRHPFDSDEGVRCLETWLRARDAVHDGKALSAVTMLPFLKHTAVERLLAIARLHPNPNVQMAWACAACKLGYPEGIEKLAAMCSDVTQAHDARQHLIELGHADAIPAATPEFQATAELLEWLVAPDKLSAPPDEIEMIDQRELAWPPDYAAKKIQLFRFRAKSTSPLDQDLTGVAALGGMPFFWSNHAMEQRPPEDVYGFYCFWEMENAKLVQSEPVDAGSNEYDALLDQWNGPALASARITDVVELDPQLRQKPRLLAIASAHSSKGPSGWAVFDGPDSQFYPEDEFPAGQPAALLLSIHVGRRLLGFSAQPLRKAFLKPQLEPSPACIVRAYEEILAQFAPSSPLSDENVREYVSRLNLHFGKYVDALWALRGGNRAEHLAEAFEKVLLVARGDERLRGSLAISCCLVMSYFDGYIDALNQLGRSEEIKHVVAFFAALWPHIFGLMLLGGACLKVGDQALANVFWVRLHDTLQDWRACEDMSSIAEILCKIRRHAEAKTLLLACLMATFKQGQLGPPRDRELYEQYFQTQRRAFLKLFPYGAADLAALNIPRTLLPARRRQASHY